MTEISFTDSWQTRNRAKDFYLSDCHKKSTSSAYWISSKLTLSSVTTVCKWSSLICLCEHSVYHHFITLIDAEGILQDAASHSRKEGEADSGSQLCVNVIWKYTIHPSVMHFLQLTFADILWLPIYSSAYNATNQYCKYWEN